MEIDPFANLRKNAHVWEGEKATLWYHEALDGSFSLTVLSTFGNKKRRLLLEIDEKNNRVAFKNEEISHELYTHIMMEIESFKGIAKI